MTRCHFKKVIVTLKNRDIKKRQGFFLILFLPCFFQRLSVFSFPDSLIFFGYINEPPRIIRTAIENRKAANPMLPKINSIKDILKLFLMSFIAFNIVCSLPFQFLIHMIYIKSLTRPTAVCNHIQYSIRILRL